VAGKAVLRPEKSSNGFSVLKEIFHLESPVKQAVISFTVTEMGRDYSQYQGSNKRTWKYV
jgi:hypothetical protein